MLIIEQLTSRVRQSFTGCPQCSKRGHVVPDCIFCGGKGSTVDSQAVKAMGIQSTQEIDRLTAIRRIRVINDLAIRKKYSAVDMNTWEPDEDVVPFVDNYQPLDVSNLEEWTDKMLEDVMDRPFFRFSMFDNYKIDLANS